MIKSNAIELKDFRMGEGAFAHRTSNAIANGMAFLRRDFAISTSYKLQFLLQFAQMFFGVTVIYFIGKMVSASGDSRLLAKYHADYFTFAIVGFAVDSYLKAGILAITSSVRQSMSQGVLEAVFATPISYAYVLLYTTLWPYVFATIRMGVYFLCGILIFGMELPHANWGGAALVLALTTPTFIMLGIISSSILILVKRGDPVNSFFVNVSGILAGTMFPIAVLPPWLRGIALCLPLTHSLEALRRCLLTGASVHQIRSNLLALAGFLGVVFPLAILVTILCMRRVKKVGAFATF